MRTGTGDKEAASRKEQLRAVLIGTARARGQGGPEVPRHFQLSEAQPKLAPAA